jgi:hypothetical protein
MRKNSANKIKNIECISRKGRKEIAKVFHAKCAKLAKWRGKAYLTYLIAPVRATEILPPMPQINTDG